MISKSFEFKKININDYNYYLFYGENNGLKNEIIEVHFKTRFSANHYNYEEDVILKNKDNLKNKIKISLKEKFSLFAASSFSLIIIFFFIDFIITFVGKPELGNFRNIYFYVSVYALLHINFRIKFMNLLNIIKRLLLFIE